MMSFNTKDTTNTKHQEGIADLEEVALKLFFNGRIMNEKDEYLSSFGLALNEARRISGRDFITGRINESEAVEKGNIIGVLLYLIVLDILKSCFFESKSTRVGDTYIDFISSHLQENVENKKQVSAALYALRCCLVHDLSLANINKRKPELTHQFRLITTPGAPIVTLPENMWKGDRSHISETVINSIAFADFVEGIISKLQSQNEKKELHLALKEGANDFFNRYVIKISKVEH
jgi:hypothetical protein